MTVNRILPAPTRKYLTLVLHPDVAYPCTNRRHDNDNDVTVASYAALLLEHDMVSHLWYQCTACNIADKKLIDAGKALLV